MYGLCGVLLMLFWNMTNNNLHELPSYGIDNPNSVLVSHYSTGRWTANCEQYNKWGMTCASPIANEYYDALPFGTLLYCTIDGHNIFVIRVNDRGPFKTNWIGYATYPLKRHPTRKLDLSYGVFGKVFGSWDQGIDRLRIVRVEFPEVEEYDVWRGEDC